MDEEFWQARWRENRISFHEAQANNLLIDNFRHLGLRKGDTVFVPLCGKSIDLDWLLTQGLRVVGIDFNRQAAEEVFARLELTPEITEIGPLLRYDTDRITLFVEDFFELDGDDLGDVNAIYDRAALVALPSTTRSKYSERICQLTHCAPQLLITFDYDQTHMDGPPFSVPGEEIQKHYGKNYTIESLISRKISGPLSQRCQGDENVWLLKPVNRNT